MPASAPPDRIIAGFQALYEEAEQAALAALADGVARNLRRKDLDDLAAKAAELTRLRMQLDAIATKLHRSVARALPETLTEANLWGGRQAIEDLNREFGPTQPRRRYDAPINQGALDALAASLSDQLTPVHLSVTRVVEDAYKDITGRSTAGVLTGHLTRVEATQRALDRFAAAGISGFVDKAGRNWQISTYAEMAIRTAAARAAVDAHVATMVENGVELGYVSDSPQECGLCRPYEHKVVTLTGNRGPGEVTTVHELTEQPITVEVVGSLSFIRALGFMHPNCTHTVSIYLPGVTKLRSSKQTANPQGYKDSQKLRYLERQVRAAKRVAAAAMTPDAKRAAEKEVRRRQALIREHVKATGQKRQPQREQLMEGVPENAITPETTLARAKRDQARERARARRALEREKKEQERARKERELAEKHARELAERRAREEQERREREERERREREERERREREERERREREERERLEREEHERREREERERAEEEARQKRRERDRARRAAKKEAERLAAEQRALEEQAAGLPQADEARIATIVEQLDARYREMIGDNPNPGPVAQANARNALRSLLEELYPDAQGEDLTMAARAAVRSFNPPATAERGRGAAASIRALERAQAYRQDPRSLEEFVAAARAQLGEGPFRAALRNGNGPDEDTAKVLEAIRAAGAAVQSEAAAVAQPFLDAAQEAERAYRIAVLEVNQALEKIKAELVDAYMAAHPRKKNPPNFQWFLVDPDSTDLGKMPAELQEQFRSRVREQIARRDAAFEANEAAKSVNREQVIGDAHRAALSRVREMGRQMDNIEWGDGISGELRQQVEQWLDFVTKSLPAEWLSHAVDQPLVLRHTVPRGYFLNASPRIIEIGDKPSVEAKMSTLLHEFAHLMEVTNPALMQAQWAFVHQRITRSDGLVDRLTQIYEGEHGKEMGWEDDFQLHYTGKVYRDSGAMNWEVLTTSIEALLGPAPKNYMDPDLAQFVLGMLAIL